MMKPKKIILAADHAGFKLKGEIKDFLEKEGYEIEDMGADSFDKEDDYPDFIMPAARKVAKEKCLGIILGGSGQGEAIAANKIGGVRAALYYGKEPDIIKLSKTHNNANMLSLGARFLGKEEAIKAVKAWLSAEFTNEERHARRIGKISKAEKQQCRQ